MISIRIQQSAHAALNRPLYSGPSITTVTKNTASALDVTLAVETNGRAQVLLWNYSAVRLPRDTKPRARVYNDTV